MPLTDAALKASALDLASGKVAPASHLLRRHGVEMTKSWYSKNYGFEKQLIVYLKTASTKRQRFLGLVTMIGRVQAIQGVLLDFGLDIQTMASFSSDGCNTTLVIKSLRSHALTFQRLYVDFHSEIKRSRWMSSSSC